jgi:hypothetical protein
MTPPVTTTSSADLLTWAEEVLHARTGVLAGCWARAVAILGRQALEALLRELWAARNLSLDGCSTRAQLLCLRAYLDDPDLAAEIDHTWSALSNACHHHPYELAPTSQELARWLKAVRKAQQQLAIGSPAGATAD